MVEHPHSIRGDLSSIPGRCSSIFGIWREVLGFNVYITSQYLTPAIIYRDIIYALYPSSTPPPKTTAIFRDFKKSTAMCKVHNVGLRYIKYMILFSHGIIFPWRKKKVRVHNNNAQKPLNTKCLTSFSEKQCCRSMKFWYESGSGARGSIPLTNGPWSGTCYFRPWPSRRHFFL